MAEPKFTKEPWQFVYGDPYDDHEDGHANGFTILMADARLVDPEDINSARLGRALIIHQIRYAEDVFPEDAGRAEAEANARLIAAAPDLHAIAEAVAEHFADTDALLGVAARAALAKARGEHG